MDIFTRVPCPYNGSHMIAPLKMPYHLHKCRKNHPNVELAVCPYNATHEVRKPELQYHMSNCPDRCLLERDMAHNALKNALLGKEVIDIKGNTDLPPRVHVDWDGLENWDEEEPATPLVVTRQATGRTQYRRPHRGHQVNSQLRVPQTQSIAASLTLRDSRSDSGSDTGGSGVSGHANQDPPAPISDRLSHLESSSALISKSRLGNLENSRLFAIGRGRARPSLPQQPVTESPPLLRNPGMCQSLTTPTYIRMGRGGFKSS